MRLSGWRLIGTCVAKKSTGGVYRGCAAEILQDIDEISKSP